MPTRYAHTNLTTPDWRRLARFYQEVFDCQPVPPERDLSGDWLARGVGVPGAALQGVHLRLPGHGSAGPTLEIFTYHPLAGERLPPAANRPGLGHLAFQVEDVAATREAVLAHGGADLGQIASAEIPGAGRLTFIYMTDPDGNILEIQSWDAL